MGSALSCPACPAKFESGSLTALIGANGSGKTTLLRAIAGLHPLAGGRIDRGGVAPAEIALLAQGSHLDRSFPITCRDVVALADNPAGAVSLDRPGSACGNARRRLDRVGLAEMESRPIQALSAGQFQRVLFARTIVQDARLILLDEPFTAVDAATTRLLMSVIEDWHAQGRTVIAVLHDMRSGAAAFPHTLLLGGQRALGCVSGSGTAGGLMLDFLLEPFALGFMRRALAGCLALSVAAPPLGVFLVLRRMSLMSDVLQHGVLPGIAVGAIFAGLSVWAMGLGGVVAGLAVAVLAGWLARRTGGREDSQLAGMYLLALAAGVALISAQHSIDLTHILFGNVLAVDDAALFGMAGVATMTLPVLALIWRPLVLESLDPGFMAATSGNGGPVAPGFPDAGGAVRCLRLRGTWHVDVGWPDDVARDRGAALVQFTGGSGPGRGAAGLLVVGRWVDSVLQPGHPSRSGDRADRRRTVGRSA